ncbi:MAG: PEP-CTERM sorting domain-containing protein [Planctomycetota bacterium]
MQSTDLKTLALSLACAGGVCLAAGPASADEDDEEGPGVPHIVVLGDGGTLELEFELVPAEDIAGVPTVTVFTPNFNPLPDPGEFTSNPLGGLADGFLNDDNGFESEEPLVGADITVTLTGITSGSEGDFFITLGDEFITSIGDAFALGEAFDDHPTFGLFSDDPSFTGSVGLTFDVTDANGIFSGTETFGLIISADPADAVVPEPTTAGLLAASALLAFRRRRSA